MRSLDMIWVRRAVAAAHLTALGPAVALSQSGPSLAGTVRDTTGAPIPMAQLLTSGIRVTSDSGGRFAFGVLPTGAATLMVRRIGFEPREMAIDLVGGRTDSLFIVLTMLPRELPEITTETDALARIRLSHFYRHKQSGQGYFFDRKQIDERKVVRMSDLLRRLPGIRVGTDRNGRQIMRMGRSAGGRDCPPDFWVDGVRAAFMNVDDVPLIDVEALEVYKGPSGLPPELNTRLGNPGCGAIVIWTRVPG
jgi:hypothetical protein